jgi:hypothetical protein
MIIQILLLISIIILLDDRIEQEGCGVRGGRCHILTPCQYIRREKQDQKERELDYHI